LIHAREFLLKHSSRSRRSIFVEERKKRGNEKAKRKRKKRKREREREGREKKNNIFVTSEIRHERFVERFLDRQNGSVLVGIIQGKSRFGAGRRESRKLLFSDMEKCVAGKAISS